MIRTVDDDVPELNEYFTVRIVSTSGDTVLYQNYTTNVSIHENDHPYGLFHFNRTDVLLTEEGEIVHLRYSCLVMFDILYGKGKSENLLASNLVYFFKRQNVKSPHILTLSRYFIPRIFFVSKLELFLS